MATQIYTTEDITLQDGREVTLKPLPIARLRRFMAAWKVIGEVEEGDDGFDIFVNCCGISLEKNFIGEFGDEEKQDGSGLLASAQEKKKGEVLSPKYRDYLGDVLDLETIYKIVEICGGIKLNDPKVIEAALAQEERGRTSI